MKINALSKLRSCFFFLPENMSNYGIVVGPVICERTLWCKIIKHFISSVNTNKEDFFFCIEFRRICAKICVQNLKKLSNNTIQLNETQQYVSSILLAYIKINQIKSTIFNKFRMNSTFNLGEFFLTNFYDT